MTAATQSRREANRPKLMTVGSVSFLNAKPLIYGLHDQPDLNVVLDVPSRLVDGLSGGAFEVALLPVIDVLRTPGLKILTVGGIGCDGPTLTVRIFSRVPVDRIRTLAADTDSHTSVALSKVVVNKAYGLSPTLVDYDHETPSAAALAADARLLIGDKVVTDAPAGFPYDLDLGRAWKELTGLPFVFAAWVCRDDADLGDLPQKLAESKRQGLRNVESIVRDHAIPRGWPADLARQYMTEYLQYDIGPEQLRAIKLFHDVATDLGLSKP